MPTPRELLDRLDSRHDELIRKLDELNDQIEQALTQIGKSRGNTVPLHDALAEAALEAGPAIRRAA